MTRWSEKFSPGLKFSLDFSLSAIVSQIAFIKQFWREYRSMAQFWKEEAAGQAVAKGSATQRVPSKLCTRHDLGDKELERGVSAFI